MCSVAALGPVLPGVKATVKVVEPPATTEAGGLATMTYCEALAPVMLNERLVSVPVPMFLMTKVMVFVAPTKVAP